MQAINIADILVILILLLAVIWGVKKGFAKAVLGLGSFVISLVLALLLYQPISTLIEKSVVGEYIAVSVTNAINKTTNETANAEPSKGESEELSLPDKIISSATEMFDEAKNGAVNSISQSLSALAVNLVSMLCVFLVVKIIMWIITTALDTLAKLPILKTLNKTLGGAFGALYGFLAIYILLSVLTFYTTIKPDNIATKNVLNSNVCIKMYDNNFIVNFIGLGD